MLKPAAAGKHDNDKTKLWLADVSVCIGDAGLSATEKVNLKRIVTAHGGTVSYLVHPKTTHLVTGAEEVRVCSQKVRTAGRYGVRLVSPAWLLESAAAGKRHDETPFLLSVSSPEEHENDRNNNAHVNVVTAGLSASASDNVAASAVDTSSSSSSSFWSFDLTPSSSSSSSTLGSTSLVNRPRGTWLTSTTAAGAASLLDDFTLSLSDDDTLSSSGLRAKPSSSSSPAQASAPAFFGVPMPASAYAEFDDETAAALERGLVHKLRLALDVAARLVPATSPYWRSSAQPLTPHDGGDGDGSAHAEQGLAAPTTMLVMRMGKGKKESWALKLEKKQKQLRAASAQRKAEKRDYDREHVRSIRRHKNDADRELEQSFKADAKQLKRQRLEQLRHQRLAKLREGWLAELARRKKRDDEKAEEKRKRREAWEEKEREKERRRQDYEQKKREWESQQAERALKQLLWDAQILQWEAQKRSELYKKFFVGNLKWTDITLEDMGSETAVEFARQKRWDRLRAVLASFGPIVRVKEHWDKHYVFVVYEEREHAEKAMEVLSSWDERVKIVKDIRKQLLDEAQPLVYTPTPDFYLRWPKKEPHPDAEEELKKKEAEEEKKRKEEERLQAEAQEIADGWEKKKPAKKPSKKKKDADDDADKEEAVDPNAPPDVRPPKKQKGLDGKSKKKREKRKKKEAEKRELEKKKGKGKSKGRGKPAAPSANERPARQQQQQQPAAAAGPMAVSSRGRGRGMRGAPRGRGGRGGAQPPLSSQAPPSFEEAMAVRAAFAARGGGLRGRGGGRGGRGRGGRGRGG